MIGTWWVKLTEAKDISKYYALFILIDLTPTQFLINRFISRALKPIQDWCKIDIENNYTIHNHKIFSSEGYLQNTMLLVS